LDHQAAEGTRCFPVLCSLFIALALHKFLSCVPSTFFLFRLLKLSFVVPTTNATQVRKDRTGCKRYAHFLFIYLTYSPACAATRQGGFSPLVSRFRRSKKVHLLVMSISCFRCGGREGPISSCGTPIVDVARAIPPLSISRYRPSEERKDPSHWVELPFLTQLR
jgi:hypothetical protein